MCVCVLFVLLTALAISERHHLAVSNWSPTHLLCVSGLFSRSQNLWPAKRMVLGVGGCYRGEGVMMGPKGQFRGTMVASFPQSLSEIIPLTRNNTPAPHPRAPFLTGRRSSPTFSQILNRSIGPHAHFSLFLLFSSVRNVGTAIQCRRRTTHSSLQKYYWGRRDK